MAITKKNTAQSGGIFFTQYGVNYSPKKKKRKKHLKWCFFRDIIASPQLKSGKKVVKYHISSLFIWLKPLFYGIFDLNGLHRWE